MFDNVIACTLHVNAGKHYQDIMTSISPLLSWVDPAYRFLKVFDDEQPFYSQRNGEQRQKGSLSTQALSVILFLHENSKYFDGSLSEEFFEDSPWKHHYTIELNKQRRPAILARQRFYQYSEELPLLSIASIHEGLECIRFQLLAENYSKMKLFYSEIFGQELTIVRKDFCYCILHREPGLQLQFSLKFLPELSPRPTKKAILIFRVRQVSSDLLEKLRRLNFLGHCYRQESKVLIPDPDGNMVLFETV